jgi:hypothetical protein
MKYLLEHNILEEITSTAELKKGDIIRRVGNGKDQQGVFSCFDDEDGLIVVNVVDMANICFAVEAGILRPLENDKLYHFKKIFGNNPVSEKARAILKKSLLYKKHPEMQQPMCHFMEHAYGPDQIIDFERTNNLKYLFIPIQQKFKLGRFKVNINWETEGNKRFLIRLDQLEINEHMTYISSIPAAVKLKPLFYSVGTQPHESTHVSLQSEPFTFTPNMGGHIKYIADGKGKKNFIVDAGSNYFGKGNKTALATAQRVAVALAATFKEYTFTPAAGRGAYSLKQSY